MRSYSRITPSFWTGKTGRAIAAAGPEAVVVAFYLMTSPHANMIGLFYQPMLYLQHETRLPSEGASKGLRSCIEAGLCSYDDATEMVWVHEMAAYQVGRRLKESDNKCVNVRKLYKSLPNSPLLGPFFDRYRTDFHLVERRGFEGALEGLRSQEQEQEQEQEQKYPSQDGEFDRGIDAYKHTHASETVGTSRGAG